MKNRTKKYSLKKRRASRATLAAFHEGLAEMIELGRVPAGISKQADAQQIFKLDLAPIVDGSGLKAAEPVAWDFLVGGGSMPVFLAAINTRGKKPPKMTSLTGAPMAAKAAAATALVENLPRVRAHRYELCRLRIPALSLGAFWLRSLEKGVGDLAVPYHAIHHQLKSMHAYPMEEFLAVMRRIAEKRLKDEGALRRKARRSARG